MDKKDIIIILLFSIIFITLIMTYLPEDSPDYHDGERIFYGLSYLKTGNTFNEGTIGIFAPALSAIPLLLTKTNYPSIQEINSSAKDFGTFKFLSYNNNNPNTILSLSHIPLIIITLLLGIYLYQWSKELYGRKAGIYSLIIFSFFPLLLGHIGSFNFDLIFATFLFITFYYFYHFINNPSKKDIILTGIFLGLSMQTKPNAYFIILSLIICSLIILIKNNLKEKNVVKSGYNSFLALITIFLITAITFFLIFSLEIHPIYDNHDPLYTYNTNMRSNDRFDSLMNKSIHTDNKIIREIISVALQKIPVPGPHYFEGIYTLHSYTNSEPDTYFMGKYITGLKWKEYLTIFFIKTPIPFLIFCLIGVIYFKKIKKKNCNEYIIPVIIILYLLSIILSKSYGGYRYFLQILPLIILFSSRITNLNFKKEKYNKIYWTIIILLFIWYIIGCIMTHPNYASYFNEFVGSENGYKYSIGSDIEKYQDFKRLESYIKEQKLSNETIYLASTKNPNYKLNFNYKELEPFTKKEGLIIIDINSLIGLQEKDHKNFEWLRELKPIKKIGYSIVIYNTTKDSI